MDETSLSHWRSYTIPTEHAQFMHVRWNTLSSQIKQRLSIATLTVLLLFLTIGGCTLLHMPWITFIALAALSLLWVVFRYPRLALLLIFASAGLPSLAIPLPGHTVRPIEMAIALSLLLILLLRPRLQLQKPHLFALLFLIMGGISFLHVPEISTNVNIPGANKRLYDLTIVFLALFCATFLFQYIKKVSQFLSTALLTNTPLCIIALLQALGVPLPEILIQNPNPAASGDTGRLVGSFNGAAEFGIYLTGMLALALCCWLLGTRRRDRILGGCMTLSTLLAIVGSGTRSALIAAGVMLLITFIVTKRIKLFVLLLSGLAATFTIFQHAIIEHFTHADTSTSNRLFLWHLAIQLIGQHPIIGIGLEQFHYYYNHLIINASTQLNQHGISVHNQYLEWGMEGGIPWLLLGSLFLVSTIVLCSRLFRQAGEEQRLTLLTAILAAIAALIIGCMDVPFDSVECGTFFCLLIGLALGHILQQQGWRGEDLHVRGHHPA
jgi:O-antigen ligase